MAAFRTVMRQGQQPHRGTEARGVEGIESEEAQRSAEGKLAIGVGAPLCPWKAADLEAGEAEGTK